MPANPPKSGRSERLAATDHGASKRAGRQRKPRSGERLVHPGPRSVPPSNRNSRRIAAWRTALSVANGTDALELALREPGNRPGRHRGHRGQRRRIQHHRHTCQWAPNRSTSISTPSTMNMSAAALASRLTPDVRAVIATHLYGRMADLPALLAVTSRAGVPLVEDCAQAHGAAIGGRKAGSWGALGCFSFYPTKNLGALGDGGAITTNDEPLAQRVKSLRQYGWSSRYQCAEYGRNSRMDEMQAAILRAKLPHLDALERAPPRNRRHLFRRPGGPIRRMPAGFRRKLRRAPLRDPHPGARSGSRRAARPAASPRISITPCRITCRRRRAGHGHPRRNCPPPSRRLARS